MKKVIISLFLGLSSLLFVSDVSAREISTYNIPSGSYIIGTHLFTRESGVTHYDGTLTVQHIMLAAQTINSNDINDMNIYFKTSRGIWMNAITEKEVAMSNTMNIEYKNIEQYPTYVANISSISKSSDINSLVKETLKVNVTDNKGNTITTGLTYEWYKDDIVLDNAIDSEYIITEYGTYKCRVYINGEFINEVKYTPLASEINYTKDTSEDTKFVFVNNPEKIKKTDLIDNDKVINKTTFDKNLELYFEHNRLDDTTGNVPIYYGIRIYNPTDQNVDLIINNSGTSACVNGCTYYSKTWEEYFKYNVVYDYGSNTGIANLKNEYVLAPHSYLYLWVTKDINMIGKTKFVSTTNSNLPDDIIPINHEWGWAFDGVVNLTAKVNGEYLSKIGANLEVSNIAFSDDFYKNGDTTKIETVNTETDRTTDFATGNSELTGEYNGKPLVTNNVKFVIDDNTPSGNLNTYYSTTDDINKKSLANGWVTNITGKSITNAYQRELLPLKGMNKYKKPFELKPFSEVVTANYTVKYLENITIQNNGTKPRNVAFYINTASGNVTNPANTTLVSFVTDNNFKVVDQKYTVDDVAVYPTSTFDVFLVRTNVQVWNITIPAGKSITIPSLTLMGGMSYGTLVKFVCVDNVCYDSFYQNEFTW